MLDMLGLNTSKTQGQLYDFRIEKKKKKKDAFEYPYGYRGFT